MCYNVICDHQEIQKQNFLFFLFYKNTKHKERISQQMFIPQRL